MSLFNPAKTVESIGADLGGMTEQSYITCITDTGVYDVKTLTLDATANINQAEFFILDNAAGTSYALWFDIDAAGTTPTGAAYTATDTQIMASIATGDTAAQVAAKVETALAGVADITTDDTAADGTMIITQDLLGNVSDITFYDADSTAYSGGGAFACENTTVGVDSNLNSKYFSFYSGGDAAFYVWLNVATEGVDPSATGTGIETAISASASASSVATAIAAAINANANFSSESDGSRIKVTNAANGNATNISAGTSGFSVSLQHDGYASYLTPYGSPSDISNNPS